MLKYIAILSNALALLIYNFFFADPVSVNQKMPVSAKPESEFVVELTINKATAAINQPCNEVLFPTIEFCTELLMSKINTKSMIDS